MKPYIFLIYLLTCIMGFSESTTYQLVLPLGGYSDYYGYLGGNQFQIQLTAGQKLEDTIIQVKKQFVEDPTIFYYQTPKSYKFTPLYLQLMNPTIDDLLKGNEIQVIAKTNICSFYPTSTPTTAKVAKGEKSLSTSTFWDNLYATCTILYNKDEDQYTLTFNLPVIRPQSGAYIFTGYTAFIQK